MSLMPYAMLDAADRRVLLSYPTVVSSNRSPMFRYSSLLKLGLPYDRFCGLATSSVSLQHKEVDLAHGLTRGLGLAWSLLAPLPIGDIAVMFNITTIFVRPPGFGTSVGSFLLTTW